MELGESKRFAAAICVAAFLMAVPAGAWADQSNDNSSTTSAGGGGLVIPVTGAVQLNAACPANVNVLANQRDSGSCAQGSQSNSNSSTTTVHAGDQSAGLVGGPVVAPITAAAQANASCPANVNVLSNQRDSGNCTPGSQSNSNSATTQVRGGQQSAGLLGGPLVAPLTAGAGLNVTCPANVNVLSSQDASGNCLQAETAASQPSETSANPPGETSPGPMAGETSSTAASDTDTAEVVTAGFSDTPGPPVTGALGIGGSRAAFPELGLLVVAVLAAAATAVRQLRLER